MPVLPDREDRLPGPGAQSKPVCAIRCVLQANVAFTNVACFDVQRELDLEREHFIYAISESDI